VPAKPLEPIGSPVGIDLGLASFLTFSDGTHFPNPRHLTATAGRLAAAQRDLARKKRGSSRRRKATAKVAGLHGKVRRQRLDRAHQTALALVREYDLIVHEDLEIKNMTARPKPRADGNGGHEPNGAAAKSGLNKSINDAGWGIFLRVLSAKAESAGRKVIAVNPRHLPAVHPMRPHRSRQPRHPGRVSMSRLRPLGPRRRQRGPKHLAGRACPSGSLKQPENPLRWSGGVTSRVRLGRSQASSTVETSHVAVDSR
jgi:putative transposase